MPLARRRMRRAAVIGPAPVARTAATVGYRRGGGPRRQPPLRPTRRPTRRPQRSAGLTAGTWSALLTLDSDP